MKKLLPEKEKSFKDNLGISKMLYPEITLQNSVQGASHIYKYMLAPCTEDKVLIFRD
ncbi:MAG: hypothetical protein LBH30_06540 [Prevotellaceae bacterium]|jgi:hypothetical protein|nr:hypothetical protein [Prevotellaceae bacterium]